MLVALHAHVHVCSVGIEFLGVQRIIYMIVLMLSVSKDAVTKAKPQPLPKCTTALMQQMPGFLTPRMGAVLAT